MPVLKNARHEVFAQEVAKGASAVDAYERAGYARDRTNASKLLANVGVQERIAELQEHGAKQARKTVEDIILQLEADRTLAYQNDSASAAVSATMGMAKILGHITERRRVMVKKISEMSEDEVRALLDDEDIAAADAAGE